MLDTGLKLGRHLLVEAGGIEHDAAYVVTFADAAEGGLLAYLDSYRNLALAVNRGSAAERLGVSVGDRIVLMPV